jgi:hypothetical protein
MSTIESLDIYEDKIPIINEIIISGVEDFYDLDNIEYLF